MFDSGSAWVGTGLSRTGAGGQFPLPEGWPEGFQHKMQLSESQGASVFQHSWWWNMYFNQVLLFNIKFESFHLQSRECKLIFITFYMEGKQFVCKSSKYWIPYECQLTVPQILPHPPFCFETSALVSPAAGVSAGLALLSDCCPVSPRARSVGVPGSGALIRSSPCSRW